MSETPLKIAIIIGSNREARLGDKVGQWTHAAARSFGDFTLDIIDVAHLTLPWNYPEGPDANVLDLRRRIAVADGFVVVTPEYNHSFPAPLKHLIDQAYDEWRANPVGFVSYGGVSGGLRAVEALRLVFAELEAVTLRDGVSFPFAWTTFEEEGLPDSPRWQKAAATMFHQLRWWATALHLARADPLGSMLEA